MSPSASDSGPSVVAVTLHFKGLCRAMLLSQERVRWWCIAIIAAMPAVLTSKQVMVSGPFQRMLAATIQLYTVCPMYAKDCRDSLQTLANLLSTVRRHVLAGCPQELEFQAVRMPQLPPDSVAPTMAGMRSLIQRCGYRTVSKVTRNGLWELEALLQLFDHSVIEGAALVLTDVIAFSEDVLYMCKSWQGSSDAGHCSSRRTPPTLDRQTPETMG